MAAIARFVSYDGGIAFSDKVLKIQTDEPVLIPLEDVMALRVRQPSEENEGFIFVATEDKRYRLYFDDEQFEEALSFKRSFDATTSRMGHSRPAVVSGNRMPTERQRNERGKRRKEPGQKKSYLKWTILIIVVTVILVSLINSLGDDKDGENTASQPTQTPTPTSIATTAQDDVVELDTLCGLIEITVKDNFENYKITHDDTTVTLNVWLDGLAAEAGTMKVTGANTEPWETMKSNVQSLAGNIRGFMDTCGRQDIILCLNVLNDLNTDNILLSYVNSALFYDFMSES